MGNEFCQKITYGADDPEAALSSFRNDYNPRIAVTVDMIATGTDVKPIIAYDNSYVYPQEAYDYIVSLNEKCGSYIKNGANCGEDCIQYLNRKPTTKTGNIYYRIIELERN